MFGGRLTLFEIFGFAIRFDPGWLLLATLVGWSLASGYFPVTAPGLDAVTYALMGLAGILGLTLSVVAHELAHAVVGRRHGMEFGGITLFVFGGVAEMESEPASPGGEFRMAMAGPLLSLALGLAAQAGAVALVATGQAAWEAPWLQVLSYLGIINLLLAGFNLIPAFPMDGGRVLRAALWAWRRDRLWATRMATRAGSAFGLGLGALGLWQILAGNLVAGFWWLVIGLFVRAAAGQAWRQQGQRARQEALAVGRLMRPFVALDSEMPVGEAVREVVLRHPHAAYPVVDGTGRLVGCAQGSAAAALTDDRNGLRIGDIAQPCGAATIGEAADARIALKRMQVCRCGLLMVTRDGVLVGVLGLSDLLPVLSLTGEAERTLSGSFFRGNTFKGK